YAHAATFSREAVMDHARRTLIATLLVAAFAATARAQPGTGTCVMGETRLATGGLNGLWTFGLRVYQWFDPATCGFCLAADGAIVLRTVEMDVFPASHQASPVEIPAVISVVGGHDPFTIRPRGDCVAVTAARSTTWGRLKSIYR